MIKNNFHVFFLNIDLALLCVLNYLIRLILGRLHEKVYNRWKSILLQEFHIKLWNTIQFYGYQH